MKFFIPNHGDTVRVRLHSGEVVDARYIKLSSIMKSHRVDAGKHNGEYDHLLTKRKSLSKGTCVFIGPSCDLVPV